MHEVLSLRIAPGQEQFIGSIAECFEEADEYARANPWFRAVFDGDVVVGFVMVSWNVEPDPPEIIGPWFLWKLIVDRKHQRKGYGASIVRIVAELVRGAGAEELLTSYTEGPGDPGVFFRALGFAPTGDRDVNGEVILRLALADREVP